MSVKKASVVGRGEGSYLRHVPWRTCVACGEQNPKRDLIRLVRSAQGEIEIDPSGKKSGRGAYLCQAQGCWQAALKNKRLEHALRANLTGQKRQELSQFSKALPS